jgi:hypothetical protein
MADGRREEIGKEEIEGFRFFVLFIEKHDGWWSFGFLFFRGGEINF